MKQQLSHYRIGPLIGAGGMGEVYRATDTRLGRDVALKVLPPEMAADAGRLARFKREAQKRARDEKQAFVLLRGLPPFGRFRDDPRFAEFLASVGL